MELEDNKDSSVLPETNAGFNGADTIVYINGSRVGFIQKIEWETKVMTDIFITYFLVDKDIEGMFHKDDTNTIELFLHNEQGSKLKKTFTHVKLLQSEGMLAVDSILINIKLTLCGNAATAFETIGE